MSVGSFSSNNIPDRRPIGYGENWIWTGLDDYSFLPKMPDLKVLNSLVSSLRVSALNTPEFIKTEGYQLTNSLIAFGRGELFGVGLGNSVEKLTHLSEAHTDFILAIIAEELGFVSVCVVVACYVFLVSRAFRLGRKAQAQAKSFESLVAQGIGLWLGLQSAVHLCVNAGALPTKGLTLPFISYGGSAMFMSLLAMAVLLRVDYEVRRDIKSMTV